MYLNGLRYQLYTPTKPTIIFAMVFMRDELVYPHFEKGQLVMFLIATPILRNNIGKVGLLEK